MEVLVVGAGEMGCWLARALSEDATEPVEIAFLDADPDAARAAATALGGGATSHAADDPPRADLVCLAVPIPAATEAIERYGPRARTAVIDVTGTMADPVAAMARTVPDRERASLHPLFAPANEPGRVPAVVDSMGPTVETALAALDARGNEVFETIPKEHDRAMVTVQARTHAAVLAFALAAEEVPDRFHTPISAGLADLAAQVTGGDGRVYADIQAAFDGAGDVADAATRIAQADTETFVGLYEQAGDHTSEDR
jgi:prephenate dehydrogenase